MCSCGSLVFHGKKGLSDPYVLNHGKITIGSSTVDDIRIIGSYNISCEFFTNELGATILINPREDKNVLVNDAPAKKYTVINDGDFLLFGKIKLQYSHPSLEKEHLEKTQKTLDKKFGISENVITKPKIPVSPSVGSLPGINSNKRRFSTGSKLLEVKSTPKYQKTNILLSNQTSTPISVVKTRFSQRIITRRNSSLASVKENEELDNSMENDPASPIPKKRSLFLKARDSLLAKKNDTFSGLPQMSTPLPPRNKTFSGNVSDISDNATTPENNVTAASITPLYVSKQKRNTNYRRSFIDFPNSSTPKSALKMNRSSSVYRPIVEDITPASPMPRSSLRNSTLNKSAFTQRRSVNFDISSASESSSGQVVLSDIERGIKRGTSISDRKRKRNESAMEQTENAKKFKEDTSELEKDHDSSSLHDSSLSGIYDLSDVSSRSNKVSDTYELKENLSPGKENNILEGQSVIDENLQNDPDQHTESVSSSSVLSKSKRANVPAQKKLNVRSKSLNLKRKRESIDGFSKTLGNDMVFNSSAKSTSSKASNEGVTFAEEMEQKSENSQIKTSFIRTRSKSLGTATNSISESFVVQTSPSGNHSVARKSLRTPSETPKLLSESRRETKVSSSRSSAIHSNVDDSNETSNVDDTSVSKISDISADLGVVFKTPKGKTPRKLNTSSNTLSVTPDLLNESRRMTTRVSSSKSCNICPISHDLKKTSELDDTSGNKTNDISVDLGVVFKTPNGKTPRKLKTPSETPEVLNESKNIRVSSSRSSTILYNLDDSNTSIDLGVVFKTPNDKTPRKLKAANNTLSETSELLNESKRIKRVSSSRSISIHSNLNDSNDSSNFDNTSESNDVSADLEEVFETQKGKTPRKSNNSNNTPSKTPVLLNESKRITRVSSRSSTIQLNLDDSNLDNTSQSRINDTPTDLGVVFKTPKGKTPSKLDTSVNTSRNAHYTSDVRSMEKSLRKSIGSLSENSVLSSSLTDDGQTKLMSESIKSYRNEKSLQKSPSSSIGHSISSLNLTDDGRSESIAGDEPVKEFDVMVSANTVTPQAVRLSNRLKTPKQDLMDISGVEVLSETSTVEVSPKNDISDVAEVKKLLRTSKVQNSPRNDLTDVRGVKKLLKTPKVHKSPDNDLTNITGVKKLLRTPKVQKSPKNDLSNVEAVKRLLRTPKVQKSPQNDLTNVGGVKKLLKTPKAVKSPLNDLSDIRGVRKLLKTPKAQKSPENDLSNIVGVKKLLKTPKVRKSPKNDLSNIIGVKKLLRTPKVPKSPKNDLTNIAGVKKLLKSPKPQKSPKNDLSDVRGVKQLMQTAGLQKSPENDLTNVAGVKKLFRNPKPQRSPKNDLSDVAGVKKLLSIPKVQKPPKNDLSDVEGVEQLFAVEDSNFDKLLGKKPVRTYGKSPKTHQTPLARTETSDHVMKWLEDQSKIQHTSQSENETESDPTSGASLEFSPIKTRRKQKKDTEETEQISDKPINNRRRAKKDDKSNDSALLEMQVDDQDEKIKKTKTKRTRNDEEEKIEPTPETKLGTRSRTRGQIKNSGSVDDSVNEMIKEPINTPTKKLNTRKGKGTKNDVSNNDVLIENGTEIEEDDQDQKIEENKRKRTRSKKEDKNDILLEKGTEIQEGDQDQNIEENKRKRTRTKKEDKNDVLLEKGTEIQEGDQDQKIEENKTKRTRTRRENKNESAAETKMSTRIKTRAKIDVDGIIDESGTANSQDSETPIKKSSVRTTRRTKKDSVSNNESLLEENNSLKGEKEVTNKKGVKRTKSRKEEAEKPVDSENDLTTSTNVETRTTRRRGKNNIKETAKNDTLEVDQEKERSDPPQKRRKLKAKEESVTTGTPLQNHNDTEEEMKETRSTRSNRGKNKKFNEDEWDTPVKKGATKSRVKSKENVEIVQTENVETVQTSENTGNKRNLRSRNVKK